MFNVVLVEPEIPPNTGNIGRLCLATSSSLHLVKPLGFSLGDPALKRAGLDYWKEVKVRTWDSFADLASAQTPDSRFFFLTTRTQRPYHKVSFRPGDFLVFGRETKGLPQRFLEDRAEDLITIPMVGTRSINLATAVAVVLFEAVRQQRSSA